MTMTIKEAVEQAKAFVTIERHNGRWHMISKLRGNPEDPRTHYQPCYSREEAIEEAKHEKVFIALRLLGHKASEIGLIPNSVIFHRPRGTVRQIVRECDFIITGIAKAA